MNAKIPDDAFEIYVAMGPGRSYQALAQKLGVDKRSIVRHAAKEDWAVRLSRIQEGSRAAADRKVVADLQAVRERQLQQARYLQGQALLAMKQSSPKDAVKIAAALAIGWKHELLLLGEPTDRQASTIEEITKREIETLLIRDGETEEWVGVEEPKAKQEADSFPQAPPSVPAPPPLSWDAHGRPSRELTVEDIVDNDPIPE